MKCLECGEELKTRHNQTVDYTFGGLPDVVIAGIDVRACSNGHSEYAIPMIEGLHKTIAFALVRKQYRLTPNEIRFLRKYLGWSQVDFAKRMGVTSESVSRWETGSLEISAPAERLIRMMVAINQPVDDYHLFDMLANLRDSRRPAKMRLSRRAKQWKAKIG